MSRQLRPRRNRPKYTLADLETDNENQSQDNDTPSPIDDMGGDESDFTPKKKKMKVLEDNDSDSHDDMSDEVDRIKGPSTTRQKRKSWAYNVGPGPLWELIEDRGWFKEAAPTGETEAHRRPRVYRDVRVREGWEVLSEASAAPYLPTDDITTEDGNFRPPPPVSCHFGPIKSQRRREMNMFDTFSMSDYFPEDQAHILNAGAPVWSMDWCPIHPEDRPARSSKKYLAIAPFPSQSYSPEIGRKVARPSYACIQIWSLAPSQIRKNSGKKNTDLKSASGRMECEMVLCIDTGPAYDLKWCPLPSHDLNSDDKNARKLGLLGGIFEDGSFAIFVVPDPDGVKTHHHNSSAPAYVRLPRPILRIDIEATSCWSLDWANSALIAIGTTNGAITTYKIGSALALAAAAGQPTVTDLLPSHYLTVHQSAIRSITWVRAPPLSSSGQLRVDQDPTIIVSVGYDGLECLTDLREGRGTVMNRTRDAINAVSYSPFTGGPITIDHENMVKAYSLSSSMLGRGHSLLDPLGPIWSVHASDYHPQLAVAVADGSCSITNLLRSTRRGGSVPFFVHKIFQMDYNQHTNEFRMLDHFLPQETVDRSSTARVAKKNPHSNADKATRPTSAWPLKIGVHRVVWNNGNGPACSGLLASATASGLCRIENLSGRWMKDKVPYSSIEGIRMENEDEGDMVVDEDVYDSGILDAEGDEEEE